MSSHHLIPLASADEWSDALKDVKHSFAHTRESCLAMHLTTGYRTFLYRYENGPRKIVCPIAERPVGNDSDIVTPYGFSGFTGNGDCPEFAHEWRDFAKRKGYICGYISINPLFQNETYFSPLDAFSSTSLYFIDLQRSLTDIFEGLDRNRKRQIKDYRASESGFVYDRAMLTEFFKANYRDYLKRFGLSGANYFTNETLDHICSLENVFMVGTEINGSIASVYIFAHTPHEGQCMFNVALPEAKASTPLLLWCGLKYFRSRKIPVMNLGGGTTDEDNVAQSKQRYGAFALPFFSLRQVYDKQKYEDLSGRLNSDLSMGYFPAYRDPNLKSKKG